MTHPTCSRGSSGSCRHLCSQPSTSQLLQQYPVRVVVPCMCVCVCVGGWPSCGCAGHRGRLGAPGLGGWEKVEKGSGGQTVPPVQTCPSPGVSCCWGRKCVFMYVSMSMYAQTPVRWIMACVSVRCVCCTHLHRVTGEDEEAGALGPGSVISPDMDRG